MDRFIEMRCALAAVLAVAVFAVPAHAQSGPGEERHCGGNLTAEDATAITAGEICETIAVLAADSLEGREAGTSHGERAAEWIAERFAAIGLEPIATDWMRPFAFPTAVKRDPHAARETRSAAGGDPGMARTANVIGVVRGTDPDLAEQAIVVGAHYDHLGHGISGSLEPASDAIHNGADDNASGVAGMLEIAEAIAAAPLKRSVVFVAFGAEELGALGSQHYVKEPAWPLEKTLAMVNLDMIGRLREHLILQGTGTSTIWPALVDSLEAAGDAPPLQRDPSGFGPSDHAAFYGADVPVLSFFTGAHEQYHKPSDDPERIHADGAERVARFALATVRAVADSDRDVPWAEAPRSERRAMAFSVGLGVIPAYGYAGEGLSLSSVRSGGPADAAGLEAGDVIVRLAGEDVADVYAYTEILAGLEPHEPVEAVVERDGERFTTTVTPEPR